MIREIFLHSLRAGDSISISELESVNEILPGDSTTLTLQNKVTFFNSNQFTLHYLILYENEMGNLYDTYIWNRFEIRDFSMDAQFARADTQEIMRLIYPKVKAGDLVASMGDPTDSYFTYSEKDAENIRLYFETLTRRHSK